MANSNDSIKLQDKQLAFTEMINMIKNQDNLIHSWTKYLLSIQAGLGIALAYLLKLGTNNNILVLAGLILLPFLGITTIIYLVNIIVREHHWQGKVIKAFRTIEGYPEIYDKDPDPDPKKHGYIARQFIALRIFLIIGWSVILIIVLINYLLIDC